MIPDSGRSAGEGIGYLLHDSWASPVPQLVKNLPAMRETWVQSLGCEERLEKGYPLQYSGLENSMDGVEYTWSGVARSQTECPPLHFTYHKIHPL